ncbi:hypothetical protein BH11ACT4_BH11ACT4_06860 [soil metagenome]
MDLSQILTVLKLSWDLPWRILASIAALSTLAGFWVGGSALGSLAAAGDWLGVNPAVSTALNIAHLWLTHHAVLPGLVGIVLEFVGLIRAGARADGRFEGRAPATALIGASLAMECGWWLPVAILAAVVVGLWLVALVTRVVVAVRSTAYVGDHEVFQAEERLRRTWASPLVAMVYIPFAPVAWMVRA